MFNKQTYIAYVSNKYNKMYIDWNLIRSIKVYKMKHIAKNSIYPQNIARTKKVV